MNSPGAASSRSRAALPALPAFPGHFSRRLNQVKSTCVVSWPRAYVPTFLLTALLPSTERLRSLARHHPGRFDVQMTHRRPPVSSHHFAALSQFGIADYPVHVYLSKSACVGQPNIDYSRCCRDCLVSALALMLRDTLAICPRLAAWPQRIVLLTLFVARRLREVLLVTPTSDNLNVPDRIRAAPPTPPHPPPPCVIPALHPCLAASCHSYLPLLDVVAAIRL